MEGVDRSGNGRWPRLCGLPSCTLPWLAYTPQLFPNGAEAQASTLWLRSRQLPPVHRFCLRFVRAARNHFVLRTGQIDSIVVDVDGDGKADETWDVVTHLVGSVGVTWYMTWDVVTLLVGSVGVDGWAAAPELTDSAGVSCDTLHTPCVVIVVESSWSCVVYIYTYAVAPGRASCLSWTIVVVCRIYPYAVAPGSASWLLLALASWDLPSEG